MRPGCLIRFVSDGQAETAARAELGQPPGSCERAARGAPRASTKRGKVPEPCPFRSRPSRDPAPLIVGVGGSAGSLTPLRELFAALPAESGMAFVVVSHQAPTGQSLLPEILAKTTDMPVREIDGETRVEPNHVYVVPRGHSVAVHDAVLSIEPIGEPSRVPLPIDFFFRALARDRGHRAVGIVLSGTGSDGTLGLAAIRAESGLCLAQDPETAEFDGMPASAIAAQATDFVLRRSARCRRGWSRTPRGPPRGARRASVRRSRRARWSGSSP